MHRAVDRAIAYLRKEPAATAKTLDDLVRVLADHPVGQDGNTAVASTSGATGTGCRSEWLRGIVRFVTEDGLTGADLLKTWAHSGEFKRDFEGRVPYLSLAAYQGLRMRLGVDTVKPDVHLHARSKAVGHRLTDLALIDLVVRRPRALGPTARDLEVAFGSSSEALPLRFEGQWAPGRGPVPALIHPPRLNASAVRPVDH